MIALPADETWRARAAWTAIALPALAAYLLPLLIEGPSVLSTCDSLPWCSGMQLGASAEFSLAQRGISSGEYAAFLAALYVLHGVIWFGLAAVIMVHKPQDRGARVTAAFLVLFPLMVPVFLGFIPGAGATVYYSLSWTLSLTGVAVFASVFPNGRFVPRWTRWPTLGVILVTGAVFIVFPLVQADPRLSPVVQTELWLSPVFVVLIGAASLQVYRFRSIYSWQERQQAKWATTGIVVALLGLLATVVYSLFEGNDYVGSLEQIAVGLLLIASLSIVPLFIGVAVLRSHLWDIDRIISRALVYFTLTASLAGIYIGTVLGLQTVLRALTGQRSQVAVVVSTLVVAAAFGPLRRRIQTGIDLVFYRQKYNATQVLAGFGDTCRDETDLDALASGLIGVVHETVHPAGAALWYPGRDWQTREPGVRR